MIQLDAEQRRELIRDLIPSLVALEEPANDKEAGRIRREWLEMAQAHGFEYVMAAWAHGHRKMREEQAA